MSAVNGHGSSRGPARDQQRPNMAAPQMAVMGAMGAHSAASVAGGVGAGAGAGAGAAIPVPSLLAALPEPRSSSTLVSFTRDSRFRPRAILHRAAAHAAA